MKVPVEDLRTLSSAILQRHGLNEEDARIVMDAIVEAELRGRPVPWQDPSPQTGTEPT